MTRSTLYLLDGYALIYRAYFALMKSPLRTASGELTSAPFGIANFLVRILDERKPAYLGVVMDSREPTPRHELYPEYKATREKMPDDLRAQIGRVVDVFDAFRVPVIEVVGEEADDVIGTLARRATAADLDVMIVSGDKDFYQLIDEHVRLLNPGRGGPAGVGEEVVDLDNASSKFGVGPDQVIDVLGLMGDASDNIPGVPGVGLKTAQKLVREWGSMERLYANLDAAGTPKLRERLEENRELAHLSKDLVTIRTDVDVDLDLERLKVVEPDREKANALFAELEFHTLLQRFGGGGDVVREAARYEAVTTEAGLAELSRRVEAADLVALHVEADNVDLHLAAPVGLAVATGDGAAFYVPLTAGAPLSAAKTEAWVAMLLARSDLRVVVHDAKRFAHVFVDVAIAAVVDDIMLAAYLLDPARRSYELEVMALEGLGHRLEDRSTATTDEHGQGEMSFAADPLAVAPWACERADVTARLAEHMLPELEAKGQVSLYRDVELPLVAVLVALERRGVALDLAFFSAMSKRLEADLVTIEEECYVLGGGAFNLNSPAQLRVVLFEQLGLPVIKRTKTGPSTDSEVLEALAAEHGLPQRILEYRELAKLKSTYVDALPAAVRPDTGRLHTSFNQTVASSGRLSSSDPNLQNIPVRTTLGREIRRGFIPSEPGWHLLVSDYSQIELRILAHLSKDENLVAAFRSGEDVHGQTAALVFGTEPEAVTPELRNRAKMVNFGVIYGMGAFGLARRLDIPIEDARSFIDGYFERFSGVQAFQEQMIARARTDGYVTTLLGRRRYLPEIESRNFNVRSFAERVAINSPIQGSAADLIKIAMIRIHRRLEDGKIPARMLLTVHDELVFEAEAGSLAELETWVREEMESAIDLDVPVVVDVGTGLTWFDAK